MKWQHTRRSEADYRNAPLTVQRAFDKQVRLLTGNLLHPSLRSKKFDESQGIWQARVNQAWRFYFTIDADTYVIVRIVSHPK